MELTFDGGRFVSLKGELNYREVLADFPTASIIRILTYNISKNQKHDELLDALRNSTADIQLITNVPSHMDEYYDSDAGRRMRSSAKSNIQIYISKLNPDNFSEKFSPFFSVHNHAKIIGTENIVYIGSANYSTESSNNIETGVLIEDKHFIQELYSQFFDEVKKGALSYFDENFSAFRLFVLSLYAKFTHHHQKMLTNLYTDYQRTGMTVADTVFLDISDLDTLYCDLDELESVSKSADEIYHEENAEYNDALEKLKGCLGRIDIAWLKELISEGGSLYNLVVYNAEHVVNEILQSEYSFEAYDEELDYFVEKAMEAAAEQYSVLHDAFAEEAYSFLEEIEKTLSALQAAIRFTSEWKTAKINPQIDNT